MLSSSLALQQAIFALAATDPDLTQKLGGIHIYDDVPQAPHFPYVTLGQTSVRDWSTGTDTADEHTLTLHVWSRARGRREVHEIMQALRRLLHDRPLTLTSHRLINLRHEFSEAQRDKDVALYHGTVRFRAVTEPLSITP